MMNRILPLLVAVFLSQIGKSEFKQQSVEFRPGYLEAGELRVEPTVPIDWEKIAQQNFRLFDLDHPDPKLIKEHWSEISSAAMFDYDAPLPSGKSGYYFAVCSTGLAEFRPDKLHGRITFPADADSKLTGSPQFTGELAGKPICPNSPLDPGFVLFSAVPRTSATRPVAIGFSDSQPYISKKIDGNNAVYTYSDREGHSIVLGTHPVQYAGLQTATFISISGDDTYLFIRWVADTKCVEACCENRYALYRIAKEVTEVLDNDYGCDV